MNDIKITVGEKISERRKQLKISQNDFANKLGKSLRTIQKYESGDIDMPLSTLEEISKVLDISMNYLVGYQPSHIKLENLSDVFAFIFELDRKKEIDFSIEIEKSDSEEWNCSFKFNGKNKAAEYNADICLAMETFRDNREALEIYWMGYETYDAWEDRTINLHQKCFLTDKKRQILDSTEIIKKRNELEIQKLEKLLAEKRAQNNGGNE